jgi:heat shock protein HslJ
MIIRLFGFVTLAFVAMAATACSGSPGTPTSPTADSGSLALTAEQLGGTWKLTSIQLPGQAVQPSPAGATYTLTLADGRLSTRADCNNCAGSFTLTGNTLNAGPALACTRAACPTMAFESTYTGILGGDSVVTLSANTLVLTSARGTLSFTR